MRHRVALSMAATALAWATPGSGQACGPHVAGAAPLADVSPNAGRGRSVQRNTVISVREPVVRITVDEALPLAGILNFSLRNVAQVERYVYARAAHGGRIQRLLIVQFEEVLPGVRGGYDSAVTNPTRIGSHVYETGIGVFNFAESIARNPGAEAERTCAFLVENGLDPGGDFLVARYARVTDPERRMEIIFFYMENLRDLGLSRAELERAPASDPALAEFRGRALRSFRVEDLGR